MSSRFFSVPVVFATLLVAIACGGKSKSPGTVPAVPPTTAAPSLDAPVPRPDTASGWVTTPPPGTPSLKKLAPEPKIRAGLTTRAETVRLSSSLPMRIRAGMQWLTAYDVVIEREPIAAGEGRAYAVHVASFRDRSGAQEYLRDLESETGLSGRVERESPTGRYAVRVGNWSTAEGARESAEELSRVGYEGIRVVGRPTLETRPRKLALHRFGAASVRTEELALTFLPAELGAWIEVDGRPYRGYVEVSVNSSNRFTVVNVLNLEDYLKGVVPAELSPAVFPQVEAIKAQAIAARTYAIRHLGQFAAEGFDICSTPACQVYEGYGQEQLMANEAVRATSTEVLTYDGEPIDALYTSTCGGHTEDVQNVFNGESQPYLVGRPCFVETTPIQIPSGVVAGLSLEAAGAAVLGFIGSDDLQKVKHDPVTPDDLRIWSEAVPAYLGQTPCESVASGDSHVTTAGFVTVLTKALCWEGRLPFLISEPDVERMVPVEISSGLAGSERRSLAYWIQQGWLLPDADGLSPSKPISFLEASEILFRLISDRGEPLLKTAIVTGMEQQNLVLSVDEEDTRVPLASQRYLYRQVEGRSFYTPVVRLLPGDRVRYHRGPNGIDILVLLSSRTSFGRSSRFYRWMVRKDQEELSRTVNGRERIGQVLDLRPKRFGKSGRVVELEIVGTEQTKLVKGLAIRRWLGLRENLFYIDKQLGREGSPSAWVFTGGGWGHGVGLCQVGAFGMASAGYTYREILGHYYPGTQIRRLEELGEREQD